MDLTFSDLFDFSKDVLQKAYEINMQASFNTFPAFEKMLSLDKSISEPNAGRVLTEVDQTPDAYQETIDPSSIQVLLVITNEASSSGSAWIFMADFIVFRLWTSVLFKL